MEALESGRMRSTGVFGRITDGGRPSVREGGRSYRPTAVVGFAGDWGALIAGSDRFSLSNCALVVVGSFRSETVDVFVTTSLAVRRGVEGGSDWAEEGVVGVGRLEMEDCAEWPSLDCERRIRGTMGPPLSETGSKLEGALSWLRRGSREGSCATGLLVNVMDAAVLGRDGLSGLDSLSLMLRWRVSFLESKTAPSPISRPDKKSSFSASASRGFFDGSAGSSSMRSGDRLFLRSFNLCSKLTGPGGSTRPSNVSSSLSAVMELDMLGLKAEAEELRFERPSLLVPP